MMNIKGILLDLDGTLLTSDNKITDYTRCVLEKCRQKGILIGIATARSELAAKKYIAWVNPDIVISNDGAQVRVMDKMVYESLMPREITHKLIDYALKEPKVLTITADAQLGYYANWESSDEYPDYSHAIIFDYKSPLPCLAYKMTLKMADTETADKIIKEFPMLSIVGFRGELWYRFTNMGVSKVNGMHRLCNFLKWNKEDIAAFGDDVTDISLITHCGVGVAMGNALDQVKKSADFIADTNDNDGVAKWIEKYLL